MKPISKPGSFIAAASIFFFPLLPLSVFFYFFFFPILLFRFSFSICNVYLLHEASFSRFHGPECFTGSSLKSLAEFCLRALNYHKWIDCGGSARWMSPFLLPFLLDPSVVLSLSWHSTEYLPLYLFPLFNNIDIQHTNQTILRHNGVHCFHD